MQKFDKNGKLINYGDVVRLEVGVGTVVETPESYLDIDGPDKVWILFETGSNKGGTYWDSPRVRFVVKLQQNMAWNRFRLLEMD